MGKIFYKALKVILWLLLILVLAGLIFLLVRAKGWPLWTGGALLLGPLGVVMAIIFIRRHLFRRREKRFVQRIVEQEPDKVLLAQAAARETSINELRASFARAREIFRRSRLTRVRNPLYSLPWFLLAGPSGSGKSSALRSARLNSLMTDLAPPHTDKPGGQCEWWFQKNSVVLDITGRFMDLDADRQTWWEFLTLFAKYRRRDPLSGLVLTVGADSLLGDEEYLITTARMVRQRVDELMRVLGARFPLYLLVTKLDAVPGFNGFNACLDEADRLQAMGTLNRGVPDTPEARGQEIVSRIAESLKTLRLFLANKSVDPNAGLTRFPEAFQTLESRVALYCRELFQENPYLETPLFRGLYFTCARHEKAAPPGETGLLARFAEGTAQSGPLPGAFLHDFFATILPEDRNLHSPLPTFLSWRNITRFAALTAVMALTLSGLGLSVHSYLRNSATLSLFANEFSQTPKLTSNLGNDVDLMLHFRDVLNDMERQNADWGLPRLGFDQSLTAESKLKQLYCDLFGRGVQDQFNGLLQGEAMTLGVKTPPSEIQHFAAYLLGSIQLVDSARHGAVDPQVAAIAHDALGKLVFNGARVTPLFADHYASLHLSYLAWNTRPDRDKERDDLIRLLDRILRFDRLELGWLIGWANELPGLSPFTMEQFWDSAVLDQQNLPQVPPAYTLRGREQILRIVQDIKHILGKQKNNVELPDFVDWYAKEYVAAWGRFAQGFTSAMDWQRNEDQWHQITNRMAEPDNPYFMLLAVMGDQIAPYAARRDNPSWVSPVMRFNTMRLQALTPKKTAIKEKVSTDISDVSNYFKELTSFATGRQAEDGAKPPATPSVIPGGAPGGSGLSPAQSQLMQLAPANWSADTAGDKGLSALKSYLDALRSLRDASQTPVSAVGLIGPKYAPAPGQPQSPFDAADRALKDLEAALGGQDAPLFDEFFLCPIRFFWGLAVVDAAEGLQHLWGEDVLVKVGQMPKDKLPNALFDENAGLVWKFVNGPAKPFLGKGANGYSAKVSNGTTFPFTRDFLEFINKGATHTQKIMPSYEVTATALPTDVNSDAQQRPFATELTLDCQEKVQQLINYNYPVTQVFAWNPNTCGKTKLTIRFKSFSASKTYSGAMGFSDFLKEFQYNSKKFSPEDFPDSKANFTVFGIKSLTVQYKLSGGVPIIGLHKEEHLKVPATITKSWGN